jgi:glycosyltransferase involved in cell wall biosynthesis
MRFSIVTIAFNQVSFVEEAILSVINQDYDDLEYIVVDPGSTDGTRAIIDKYADRITKIIYRPDRGPADGLNTGFDEATGSVFGFLNADDKLLPGALKGAAAAFQAMPDIAVVSGHMWIVDRNGVRKRKSFSDQFHEQAYAYGAVNICQQSTFFRAELFGRPHRFNWKNRIAWDAELFLDMLCDENRHAVINSFMSEFRIYGSSITGRSFSGKSNNVMKTLRFPKIKKRNWQHFDNLIRVLFLIRKYVLEPRSFVERLTKGPIHRLTKK